MKRKMLGNFPPLVDGKAPAGTLKKEQTQILWMDSRGVALRWKFQAEDGGF